ncbi:hypothetical protein LVR30_13890 [Pantoea ananatis]|uniref:hypothetical protein n=1 Tax=Pantoea ananas TaxID=553 RepID=UPI0020241186|nr:hypothetical protein [Pantoea ananatis]URL13331.1 hypothetical protein LVR30_13890 [Pantoea ananatis]
MAVSYQSFNEVAQDCVSKQGEMWVRNAVSRSYYSFFHSALRLTNGKIPERDSYGERLPGGTHQRFADFLCDGTAASEFSLDVEETKKVGLALKTAHHRRINSDYRLDKKINRLDAVSTIELAEEMALLIDSILSRKQSAV